MHLSTSFRDSDDHHIRHPHLWDDDYPTDNDWASLIESIIETAYENRINERFKICRANGLTLRQALVASLPVVQMVDR
jgi:hypothetical protein